MDGELQPGQELAGVGLEVLQLLQALLVLKQERLGPKPLLVLILLGLLANHAHDVLGVAHGG